MPDSGNDHLDNRDNLFAAIDQLHNTHDDHWSNDKYLADVRAVYDAADRILNRPEPVDIAALRDAAIDALLRADAHRGTPYEPGADDLCTAYESAARAWATAAGHRDA